MYSVEGGGKLHTNLLRRKEGKLTTEAAAFAKLEDKAAHLTASNTIVAYMRYNN
jgi:hypothetical protein